MPVERIIIKPDEFRTKDASGNTTFWSGNQYLKTDAAGQFKAGGYQRAPVIAGSGGSITDQTTYGGYPITAWSFALYQNASTGTLTTVDSVSGYLPYDANTNLVQQYVGGPPILMGNGFAVSDWLTYNFNGQAAGSYRWLADMRGIPTGSQSPPVRPVAFCIRLTDFNPTEGAGTYTFFKPTTFYNVSDGAVNTSPQPRYFYSLRLLYTKNPINLELAVTP